MQAKQRFARALLGLGKFDRQRNRFTKPTVRFGQGSFWQGNQAQPIVRAGVSPVESSTVMQ